MATTRRIVSFFLTLCLIFSFFGEPNAKLIAKSKSGKAHAPMMMKKMQRLVELMERGRGKSIELSLQDYRELVFDSPRNHTTFVLFYNGNEVCDACEVILEAFDRISRSYMHHYTSFDKKTGAWDLQIPVFFAKFKMSEGHRQMLVDLNPSKPSVFYFAPALSSKYNQFEQMKQEALIPDRKYTIGRILAFIEKISDLRIPLEKETQPSSFISNLLTAALLGIMILFNIFHFGYWNKFIEAIKQGNYSYFITVTVIWLLSGQMFNYIRYTPMFGSHGYSVFSLIYPGTRGQYGSESILIMVIYAIILYSLTSLIESRERQLSERLPITDVQGGILGGLSGFYFGFMVLQVISQIKTGR